MMEKKQGYQITPFSEIQSQTYINACQLWQSYLKVREKINHYQGSMHWKHIKGKKYLFKASDRCGNGKSLGASSTETKKIFEEFQRGKKENQNSMSAIKQRLNEQARFCKAANLHRVPVMATKILRVLEREGLLGQNIVVVGTNALFAYETAAGCYLDSAITATRDMDLLWDHRQKMTLLSAKSLNKKSFMAILKKADKSFEPFHKTGFRAVNVQGYLVDIIKPIPKPLGKTELKNMGSAGDLLAAEIRHLEWLLSSPKFSQIVIGADGLPLTMVVPDPRAFALHKMWLSKQIERDPVKKPRDRIQALITAELVMKYLPQFVFSSKDLLQFPKKLVKECQKTFLQAETFFDE